MKQFLGYEWSKRKGSEGIKYLGARISDEEMEVSKNQAINSIETPLFNPTDLHDSSKVNSMIRDNFNGKLEGIPSDVGKFTSKMSLVDMLDFTQTSFDAQIKTTPQKSIKIESKYTVKKLGTVATIQKGSSITQAKTRPGDIKVVAGGTDFAYMHDTPNRTENIITVSASGANAGFVNYWEEPIFASDSTTIQGSSEQHTKYIFNYLKSQQKALFDLSRGAAQPHVYRDDLAKFPIPEVPDEIQKNIVDDVKVLDEHYAASRMKIDEYREKITEIFRNLDVLGGRV